MTKNLIEFPKENELKELGIQQDPGFEYIWVDPSVAESMKVLGYEAIYQELLDD